MPQPMIVGVGWYTEDEWTMLKLTADDPDALDATYEKWLANAEKTLRELSKQRSLRAVKVPVEVQKMRQWCREHGEPLNGANRAKYVSEIVQTTRFD